MHAAESAALVLRSDSEGIATLTLNRPASRNALSMAMMAALIEALDAADADPAVKVVVIAAEGPAFCAGHDLKEMRGLGQDAEKLGAVFARCSQLMQRMQSLRQPVIARVHAMATAAGCQIVATADLAIAAEGVRFATPGVNIGLFCSTPMVALTRNIGRKQAMEMLLTGETIDAAAAERFGLINRAVPAAALDAAVLALARHRLEIPPHPRLRQGSLLPPGGNADDGGLCLCLGGDDPQHAGARRPGRHRRLHRETRGGVVRLLIRTTRRRRQLVKGADGAAGTAGLVLEVTG